MVITAVFDAIAAFDIEVPDGATEEECMKLAGEWLDEHYSEVSDSICESEIDVKEVWL